MSSPYESPLEPIVDGVIWTKKYPFQLGGVRYHARTTVVRLAGGRLLIHSPGPLGGADDPLVADLAALGEVAFLVAPGNFHHLHVAAWQRVFPAAETHACPGVERKQPRLAIDWFLGDRPPAAWAGELEQVLVRGNRMMWEVAFFHRASATLILTDLVENIRRDDPAVGWQMRWIWMPIFRQWRAPMTAPEYKFSWTDKIAARGALERILAWAPARMIVGHGAVVEGDVVGVCRQAWARLVDRPALSPGPS